MRAAMTTTDPARTDMAALPPPATSTGAMVALGRVVLGVVAAGWVVVLAAVARRPLYVSHDSISNYAHIWYVSEQLRHGRGLPLHLPMLAQGKALAFPYAFIPWTSAALLRPLLGDWVVTVWLVGGFVTLVWLIVWALPELRRAWSVAIVLVNPALVMALLVGQIPFIWATALLFAAIGMWRRNRRWLATVLTGLAITTHPVVLGPIAIGVVLAHLPWARPRRALLGRLLVAVVIAAPAAVMMSRSPAVTQSSPWFRLEQLIRIVTARGTVVAVPFTVVAWGRTRHRWLAPGAFVVLGTLNAVLVGPMNRYAWAAPWRRNDERVATLIGSSSFTPGATYRVLGFSDGRVSMYRLIQHGARLDSEFFPESQARHSWPTLGEYEQFLTDRNVDYVMAWTSYDRRWRTNEHQLLRRLRDDRSCTHGPLTADRVLAERGYDVYAIRSCQAAPHRRPRVGPPTHRPAGGPAHTT
jgi:hypothetical protein